jgi:hypothetical protein
LAGFSSVQFGWPGAILASGLSASDADANRKPQACLSAVSGWHLHLFDL